MNDTQHLSPPRSAVFATPLVGLTVLVHVAAFAAVLVNFSWWPWALAAIVINHAFITIGGLLPRCSWLGENWTRLPAASAARGEVALTIDDGPDPDVTPAVLALLAEHRAKATFFCIGRQAALHPEICREIINAGHSIENHSQHHRHNFSFLGSAGFARELAAAQNTLQQITGERPRFFRAPAGLRNPFLDPVLQRLGLRLASWTRRAYDTRTGDAALVTRRLVRSLRAGDILLLHDGHCARTATGSPVILEVLPGLLNTLRDAGLTTVTLKEAAL